MIKLFNIKIAVLICFLLNGSSIFSQDKQIATDNEQDKKYTPNPSSIFNTLNKKRDQSYSSEITIKNLIKFCPTMAVRQKIMLYYERELTKNFTINVGIAKAFGDDFFQRTFFGFKSLVSDDAVLSPYDILQNSKFDRSLPYLYLGGRIYFSSSTFDEGFIEFAYRNERTEYLLANTIESNGYTVDGSNRAIFKMNAFSFGYGFIELAGPKNNISHEVFINFGVKLFRYSQFDAVRIPYTNGSGYQDVYQKTNLEQKTRLLPAINVGYCFGFGF